MLNIRFVDYCEQDGVCVVEATACDGRVFVHNSAFTRDEAVTLVALLEDRRVIDVNDWAWVWGGDDDELEPKTFH